MRKDHLRIYLHMCGFLRRFYLTSRSGNVNIHYKINSSIFAYIVMDICVVFMIVSIDWC